MTFEVSIPARLAFSWESQVSQYPAKGPIGIHYFAGETDYGIVHCLLYRSTKGEVVGILNYYDGHLKPNVWETAGNVNVWVHPDRQRQGIATALLRRAKERWPEINLDQQRFTESGAALATRLREDGIL
jgi:GNAT superfamily N-acetyltransferase